MRRKRVDWDTLHRKVIARDLVQAWQRSRLGLPLKEWSLVDGNPCVARFLDPSTYPCEGPMTLDHVKDRLMMGRKAPDDEQHLVTICVRHHLDLVAGANWATSHRPLLREYLRGIYG